MAWLAVSGLVLVVRLPRWPSVGEDLIPQPAVKLAAAGFLIGMAAIFLATALLTATEVTERALQRGPLHVAIGDLRSGVHHELSVLHQRADAWL